MIHRKQMVLPQIIKRMQGHYTFDLRHKLRADLSGLMLIRIPCSARKHLDYGLPTAATAYIFLAYSFNTKLLVYRFD